MSDCATTAGASPYLVRVTERALVDEVLHRVNNLLATIEVQSEVARTVDTSEAMRQALEFIVESARRTQQELQKLRPGESG